MGVGRIVKTAIKYGPIAYPIIRKLMKNKKGGNADTSQYRTDQPKKRK